MHDGMIADAIGASRKTAWAYRNGAVRNPSWSAAQAIERLYEKKIGATSTDRRRAGRIASLPCRLPKPSRSCAGRASPCPRHRLTKWKMVARRPETEPARLRFRAVEDSCRIP
jgi:hypothetical protein